MSQGRNAIRTRLTAFAPILLAVMLCALPPSGARAGGVPVIDFINWIQNYLQQYQATTEYSEEAKRWYDTYQHMQQQLIRLKGFTASMGPMADQLSRRSDDYGMTTSCRGSRGGVALSALKATIGLDLDGDIRQQQVQLCERIVLAENAKYNETVDMLQRLRERAEEFQQIERGRASVGDSQGDLEANDNDVARFSAGMQMELDYWEAMIAGYDSYIGLLKVDQQRLAIQAMNGPQKSWGTVIQGAALKGALEAAGTRDR